MDIIREIKRLVDLEKKGKVNNTVLETLKNNLNIYKYTYDEFEIGGVGYLLAANEEEAKKKMPHYGDNNFDFGLYYVISLSDLKKLLSASTVEVTFEDMYDEWGDDTFRNLLD